MMTLRILPFALVTLHLLLIRADNPCRFDNSKGVIDLSTVGRSDGKAAFPDKTPPTSPDYKYSYNPCQPFTEEPACKNVAACQVSQDGKYSFSLGAQDSATWDAGAGLGSTPSISYSEGPKKTTVTLVCSTDGTSDFEALGESPTNTYKFRLTHKCACWDGCGGGPPHSTTKSPDGDRGHGIGGGGVFIIILIVLAVVYFVGFALYYRFRLQRSGAELIAHRTFWASLPGYAKDGAVFVYQRATSKGSTYQSV